MNSTEQIIKKIEQNLQIIFDGDYFSNGYSVDNGIITRFNFAKLNFKNFDVLNPVFNTIKELAFEDDCIFNNENIVDDLNKFTNLTSLSIYVNSIEFTNDILSLPNLKELRIFVHPDVLQTATTIFNLKKLQHLEFLHVTCENHANDKSIILEGIENLPNLKELWLDCDCSIRETHQIKNLENLYLNNIPIENIPAIDSLKTLELYLEEDYKIDSLERFPNLESLEIQGCPIISLGRLHKLKVLIIQYHSLDLETTNCFDYLPNLEQLSLYSSNITVIKNLDQLKNLKRLDLSENLIESLEGLENLVSLERLNLFENNISDISLLNSLPKLSIVNIACNNIEKKDIESQIDKPEIVKWLYLPAVPFFIGLDRS